MNTDMLTRYLLTHKPDDVRCPSSKPSSQATVVLKRADVPVYLEDKLGASATTTLAT